MIMKEQKRIDFKYLFTIFGSKCLIDIFILSAYIPG